MGLYYTLQVIIGGFGGRGRAWPGGCSVRSEHIVFPLTEGIGALAEAGPLPSAGWWEAALEGWASHWCPSTVYPRGGQGRI